MDGQAERRTELSVTPQEPRLGRTGSLPKVTRRDTAEQRDQNQDGLTLLLECCLGLGMGNADTAWHAARPSPGC